MTHTDERVLELRAYLERLSALRGGRGADAFVLRHGRPMTKIADHQYPLGSPQQCFNNAFNMLAETRLTYCEGFASNGFFPVHHAWLLNSEGEVVEVTPFWDSPERVYYGVAFDIEYVLDTVSRTGYPSMLYPCEMYNFSLEEDDPTVILAKETVGG